MSVTTKVTKEHVGYSSGISVAIHEVGDGTKTDDSRTYATLGISNGKQVGDETLATMSKLHLQELIAAAVKVLGMMPDRKG